MYNPIELRKITLDKGCVAVQKILTPAFMVATNLEWSQEWDFLTQNMVLDLRYWFAKKDTITTIQRPRTWWDAFKYTYRTSWWLRWATPAQMEDIVVTHARICPHLECSSSGEHLYFLLNLPHFTET